YYVLYTPAAPEHGVDRLLRLSSGPSFPLVQGGWGHRAGPSGSPTAHREREGEPMRAVVYNRYGPPGVLRLAEITRPVPQKDEVLVRVHATTVNRTDCAIRDGGDVVTRLGYSLVTTGSVHKALLRPQQRILGTELAGEVAATGAAVREFAVG